MYSYKYSFCRRAIVATFDLSAANLNQFEEDHWLSCDLNVICLRLEEKAFIEPLDVILPIVAAASPTPRASKRRWLGTPPRNLGGHLAGLDGY